MYLDFSSHPLVRLRVPCSSRFPFGKISLRGYQVPTLKLVCMKEKQLLLSICCIMFDRSLLCLGQLNFNFCSTLDSSVGVIIVFNCPYEWWHLAGDVVHHTHLTLLCSFMMISSLFCILNKLFYCRHICSVALKCKAFGNC